MGSCLSPSIADLVMDILIDHVKSTLDYELVFIKKYVDDLILAIPKEKADHTLTKFNEYDNHIQFTMELEIDGRIPFLDMMLTRNTETGIVTTDWYMKTIASGRILNYYSAHSYQQKIGTAAGLVQRIISLTSQISSNTYERIHALLSSNNYPKGIINKLIHRYSTQIYHINDTSLSQVVQQQQVNVLIEPKIYRSLLFVGELSYKLCKFIKQQIPNLVLGLKCPIRFEGFLLI